MTKDLTKGHPGRVILSFSIPMIIGNLFQQLYNVVDTLIVGRFIGPEALAAVGSSFAVVVFVTSIIIGLCMGASVVFSQFYGARRWEELHNSIFTSLVFIGGVSLALSVGAVLLTDTILRLTQIPPELMGLSRSYLVTIFAGIFFTFLYNWASCLLRALGNSATPLYFLILAAVLNAVLDLVFILQFHLGVFGAALATIIAQLVSAVLCLLYCRRQLAALELSSSRMRFDRKIFRMTAGYSVLTSAQQSIMNLGILMVQGLVNSFGTATIAAFAAAVKIDSFAYMPVQDFGNAFSTYIAQNTGAGQRRRIDSGIRWSVLFVTCFCLVITVGVTLLAPWLMTIFVDPVYQEIIQIGCGYLRVVALFYCLIGYLFLLYGLFRGLGRVAVSILLTVISLGIRVGLAYLLAPIPQIGLNGIWWAIPTGWLLADAVGCVLYLRGRKAGESRPSGAAN